LIQIIGKLRILEFKNSLLNDYNIIDNIERKVEIITAFRNFSDTSLNDFLCNLLETANKKIRLEAVRALATCGTLIQWNL